MTKRRVSIKGPEKCIEQSKERIEGNVATDRCPDRRASQFPFPRGGLETDALGLVVLVHNQSMPEAIVDDLSNDCK